MDLQRLYSFLDGNILHLEQGDVVCKVYTNSSSLMNTDLTEKNLEIAQLKAELAEAVRQRNIAKVEQMREEQERNERMRNWKERMHDVEEVSKWIS